MEKRKDILVEVDEEYLATLGKKIKFYFDEKNKKRIEDGFIHIGDITDCLRKHMISKQNVDNIENSIYDYTNWMQGLNSESSLVEILSSTEEGTEYQKHILSDGVTAHPDYIENEVVFELKSTNKISPFILSDDVLKGYVRQIVYYMVLMGFEKGRIIARYNLPYFPEYCGKDETTGESLYKLKFHKDTGQFPFFAVKITIPLDAPIRNEIKDGLLNILTPIYEKGDVALLPRLDNFPNNWKCKTYCKVRNICELIPDETDPNNRDILLNKHIDEATNKVRRYGKKKLISLK